jgi:hypothetical protein
MSIFRMDGSFTVDYILEFFSIVTNIGTFNGLLYIIRWKRFFYSNHVGFRVIANLSKPQRQTRQLL